MLINNQSSRDESDSVLNNQSDSLGASHHVNQVSQYVILNIDKSTLEYKNNKNLILKHNNLHREAHHNFEKHLNDINQLRKELQEKRFISPVGMCENLNNNNNNVKPLSVPKIETFHVSNDRDKAEAMRANILRAKRISDNHFHGLSLHESPKPATNVKSIPCIVIQGNASDLNNKTFNVAGLTGKLLCARSPPTCHSHRCRFGRKVLALESVASFGFCVVCRCAKTPEIFDVLFESSAHNICHFPLRRPRQ